MKISAKATAAVTAASPPVAFSPPQSPANANALPTFALGTNGGDSKPPASRKKPSSCTRLKLRLPTTPTVETVADPDDDTI